MFVLFCVLQLCEKQLGGKEEKPRWLLELYRLHREKTARDHLRAELTRAREDHTQDSTRKLINLLQEFLTSTERLAFV